MIGLIGLQRFLIIVILAGLAISLGVANFQFLRPKADALARELSAINNEESTLRAEIETMQTGMEQFKQQQVFFEKIDQDGFFNLQDRVSAREIFNAMQDHYKLISLKYEVRSAFMTLPPPDISDDKYALLNSPLTIEIDAIDDLDVYKFMSSMLYMFPGIVNVTKFEIDRSEKLTTDMLRKIGSGEAHPLIKAVIEAEWVTAAPRGTAPWAQGVDPAANGGVIQ